MLHSKWFITPQPKPEAELKILCFPYAGGNASTYLPWSKDLPEHVELIAVQLPGRANRLFEPAHSDMDSLVNEIMTLIPVVIDRNYILFGHSLGSRVAFEVMHQCKLKGLRMPKHFIASGSRAPDIPSRIEAFHHLPDDEFIQELAELNGTPKEILENEELMAICLPALRADFKVSDSHIHKADTVLDCHASLFTGREDSDISESDLTSWEKFFSKTIDRHSFAGDHFFIENNKGEVLKRLGLIIRQTLAQSSRWV